MFKSETVNQLVQHEDYTVANEEMAQAQNIVDYHPTNSVMGAIIANEAQKVVTKEKPPVHGLIIYEPRL